MSARLRTIEIDADVADALEARAAERGVSVSQLLTDVARGEDVTAEERAINELDRRWAAVQTRGETVSNDEVVRWLRTWGTTEFRAWRDR